MSPRRPSGADSGTLQPRLFIVLLFYSNLMFSSSFLSFCCASFLYFHSSLPPPPAPPPLHFSFSFVAPPPLFRCTNDFTGDRCQTYVMASFYRMSISSWVCRYTAHAGAADVSRALTSSSNAGCWSFHYYI